MSEVWYRGESTLIAPAKPGAHLHDFGDGVYFTDTVEVAKEYAQTRVANGGGEPRVLALNIERSQLGKYLDLNTDVRWAKFIRTPLVPNGLSPEQIIRTAGNENYSRFFSAFIAENKINLREYSAVIGPEFVRGGTQLCVLHIGGQPSTLAQQLRQLLRPVPRILAPTQLKVQTVSSSDFLSPKSGLRRVAGNQAAAALFGQLIVSAMQSLGEYGIRQQIQRDIDTRLSRSIGESLSRGKGVLVISAIEEAITVDFNGTRVRLYLTSYIQPGISSEAALEAWQSKLQLLQGPSKGFNLVEQYVWVDP